MRRAPIISRRAAAQAAAARLDAKQTSFYSNMQCANHAIVAAQAGGWQLLAHACIPPTTSTTLNTCLAAAAAAAAAAGAQQGTGQVSH
jgi:hypothetical protein